MTWVTPALAQDTARTSRDSIAARLERAEEAIAFLRQQLADASESSVHTRSRLAMEINGRVLVNAFSNTRRVNNVDVPVFVRPDTNSGLPLGGAGIAIRQTTLGFAVTSSDVLGAAFTGGLDVDFYGGQQPSSGGRTFPLVRMRIAKATLTWPHAELMMGQDAPLVSQLNPVSLASVGVPGFTAAGNLWLWLPQVRLGVNTTGDVRFGVQGAILAPTSGDPAGLFDTDNDIAERSKRPYVEGRAHMSWGEGDQAGSIGVGAHDGWFATPGSPIRREGRAFTADAKVPMGRHAQLLGEWYSGDGTRGLGGGAIGQLFGVSGSPIHSTGGWAQLNLTPDPRLTIGAGYGMDDPDDADLPVSGRLKNAATEVHVHIRPAGPLLLGFEYRRLETMYRSGPLVNDHLNVAVGFTF
ncbi:MAG: hypothetical protein U9Q74_07255 [Gemmatimonadota bacterium]|nr:hypothetical protein [Gemmatimonadota bacterium]